MVEIPGKISQAKKKRFFSISLFISSLLYCRLQWPYGRALWLHRGASDSLHPPKKRVTSFDDYKKIILQNKSKNLSYNLMD